jgi:hypothetical protein
MSRRVLTFLLFISAAGFVGAQTPARPAASAPAAPDALYRRATEAWEAGQYPDALTNLPALMKSPAAAEYLDRVALLTGELFVTTELTNDGRNPKISPNGQYISYEFGPAADASTRVMKLDPAPAQVTVAKGTGLAFDAGSRAAMIVSEGNLVTIDFATGRITRYETGNLLKATPFFGAKGALYFVGADPADATRNDIYLASETAAPVRVTTEPGFKSAPIADPSGAALIYTVAAASPIRGGGPGAGRGAGGGGGGGGRGGQGGAPPAFGVVNLAAKATRIVQGAQPAISANGQTIAWISRGADQSYALNTSPTLGDKATVLRTGLARINAPALSPDGSQVAYEYMANTDWEIYVSKVSAAEGGTNAAALGTTPPHVRITRDIQHDILPRFLTNTTLLGMMGEARHRRSQIYDLTAPAPSATRQRLFANNTIRTISPEYVWLPSDDGRRLAISAERDGDTVSVERGVYLLDLTKKVSVADVLARLDRQAAAENDLRSRMTKAFAPIADLVKRVVAKASVSRVYEYEKTQFDFDSKYVSQPGNNKAIEYLTKTYASFGYKPEQQWFSPPQAAGGKTANVVNVKLGTENPDLIYVVSSHFDSVVVGPGADDDTSGTAALLETARILADVPLPATVVFASFTGEEAGLLGSREFVRLAAEKKWNIVGALNNDMIGWGAEGSRMDNTIRYSNAGIRDIQHGASFFTNLILYDAKYYKSTDAAAFYDGWGDIVGGIGSYPVLANPNYHQPTDFIETMNFRQIAETAKVTAATLVYLASSPSRLKDLKAERKNGTLEVTWTASPEKGVRSYIVAYGPASDPMRTRVTVTANRAALPAVPAGAVISVKAVNARGLEGWDWARVQITDAK